MNTANVKRLLPALSTLIAITLASCISMRSEMSIQEMWLGKVGGIDPSKKGADYDRLETMEKIFRTRSPSEIEAECQDILAQTNSYDWLSDYQQVFLQAYVDLAAGNGDAGKLVSVLSRKCPQHVGGGMIEEYLAACSEGMFEVMFCGYDKAVDKQASSGIAKSLARAFPAFRATYEDDSAFVNACRTWWLSNNHSLVVNPDYPYSPSRVFCPGRVVSQELFIPHQK